MRTPMSKPPGIDYTALAKQIELWAKALGFQQIGITDTDLNEAEPRFVAWLEAGFHGEMSYMSRHGTRRSRPNELLPGTIRIISARMDYLPTEGCDPNQVLGNPELAYISRYALGRDYHKLMRRRLEKLARQIAQVVGPFGYRAFTDSAPVLEKALAEKAGLGWIGKHSNLLQRDTGSWFFIGELYTDLPLPTHSAASAHCGTCTACIDACPTGAIVAPFQVDARRCISYLTIELHGSIPEGLRTAIGNRVYGCDDCQLVCPWNRFAQPTVEPDFAIRHNLDRVSLIELFTWEEAEFLGRTEGMAIRRIGYERWLRNLAVALGNAPPHSTVIQSLSRRAQHPSAMVREHVAWALEQQHLKLT